MPTEPEPKKIERVRDIKVEPAKYLEMPDFSQLLALWGVKSITHNKCFFYHAPRVSALTIKDDGKFIDFFDVPSTFYSKGDFKKFIAIENDGSCKLTDTFPQYGVNIHVTKVLKYEDYELGDIDKKIIEAIEKTEEKRKS